ncbi:MmgE/PrpD family protein [Erwinia sp. V71]|uniref:MmgE/PrpD family protein n=1 Tax=Erwinia sp. V71 TaxID=3369424 RepID=UPI003F5FA486
MSLTLQLAERIVSVRPGDHAREKARQGVLDFIAVCLPVISHALPDSGLQSLRQVYRGKDSQTRALLLGYAGHALDYDDFHPDFRGHPGTVILPALLALAEEHPTISHTRFLDAYIAGVEVAGRLGLAAGPRHYQLGFHNTATLGVIAAAAAGAYLLTANREQTTIALGIAATRASGLRAQFGSAVKPLHAGFAAQAAVSAVQLTLAGFHGQSTAVLERFLAAYGDGQQQPEKLTADWGAPWRIITPGLEFKPWPTCAGTHSAADAARLLRQQWLQQSNTIEALIQQVVRIEVAFPPGGDIAAFIRQPVSGIEARFSLEYVIAMMLLRDELRVEDFAEQPVEEEIMALASKVTRCPDASAPPDELNPALRFHQVTLYLRNGEHLQQRVTRQQSIATPVDLPHKLRGCLPEASEEQLQNVVALCQLQNHADLQQLCALLK